MTTTPPVRRRRTAQQILLRRACQTKGLSKIQDVVEFSGKYRNGEKGGIVVLPTMARDLGPTQVKSPPRTVPKPRKLPAASICTVSGERKTAGKLSSGENLRDTLSSSRKLKPSECKRNVSGQRSGYTSRGSTKSQNSASAYPSKWPKTGSTEEAKDINSKASLDEITNCSPLNRTPYDHNLNTPLKSGDSSLCPPIKKKARRRNLKVPGVCGVPTKQTKTNHSSGDRTNHKRASSQSSGARVESRVYSGEEVCQATTCPSKSNSENSNDDSSKCKLSPGVTFKNYGGYSPSETEFDTVAETDTNRHCCRCTDSFFKKIDKVSRPPHMYVNNAVWSLNMPSKTEVQEILDRVDGDDHRVNMTLSSRTSNKTRERRDGERITYCCNCSSKANRKGCATDEDMGCACFRRSPEACISLSRNSVRFCGSDGSDNDYRCHRSPREENYPKKRPCDDCGYSYKQSNGYESGHGTGRSRREPTSCQCRPRLPRPAYPMGAYWSPYATGNGNGGRRTSEAEYECMPGEAFANKKCTEAVTQTSKIIMTRRIDERASPNCSYNQVQGPLEENRCCRSKNKLSETEFSAQLKKQEQFITEQKSKLSGLRIVKSKSLIIQPDQNQVNLVRTKSVELEQMPSCRTQALPPPPNSPCKEEFPPLCPPCKQGSSNSYQKHNHNQFYEHLANQDTKNCPSVTASLCECTHEEAKLKRCNKNPRKRGRKASKARTRSSSQKKDVNNCRESPSYHRRTQSYENWNYKRPDQAEDQCDVIKILSILQKTVAGLEQEIKKGKGYESSRSSGNGYEPKWKKLCPCDEQNTNLAQDPRSSPPCPQELSPGSSPCEQDLSPACAQELPPSCPCQQEASPCGPPCQQEASPCGPPCQQKTSPCSSPCQQELPSMSPPCQQDLSPCNPPCQQELPSQSPCQQQELHLPCSPFKKKSSPLIPPRQKGSSRTNPPCQPRTGSPCRQGWSPSYHPCNYHYPSCRFRCPQRNNGAVPVNFGRQVNTYYPNNHCKYGMNQANMYQDRKALPLVYNWDQTNQRGLRISYRNVPDQGIERGYTRAELKYPANLSERKNQLYPCNEPIYAAGYKANNKSISDPEGHRIFSNTDWYANNRRSNACPGNPLGRSPMSDQRYGKYSVDPAQLGNQDITSRGRVTFQKHVSSRSPRGPCYQSECSIPYGNLQYFEEMKTVLANMNHKAPCKGPQNADHFRKEVCCKDPYSLNYRLAPAEFQASPQAREINQKCAPPVPRPDFDDCEIPNCRKHVKEIDSLILESPNYADRYPRSRPVIESDISNFPDVFSRNRQDNDSGICDISNVPDRFPRKRPEVKTIICQNPNCPYRYPRNREEIDSIVCENPNSAYRFPRNRKDIDSEVCDDPNCPYGFQRNRNEINSEVCQSPNCPYRFQEKRMGVESELCDDPNCPYGLVRNREDVGSEICDDPNCPYFQRKRKEIEICGSPNCPYRFPRNREDIVSEVCDNPNCPYRFQGNRKDINSELCESPNSRDRIAKRAPNKTIICTNPQCPNKIKRGGAIPYQEFSESLLRESPQSRCATTSSIESCADPNCPAIKNNLWLSGGFESFDSNSMEYKPEENRLKEGATDSRHEDFSRRQRVVFTDVTNNITRQDSGQSDRFDDESTQTKASSKNWCHRYVPFEKIPIHIASGMHPQNRTRNRHNPYLMEDHQLNSYDKHILNNYERDKIEKCKPRESVQVRSAVRKPLNQIPTRSYNCCYPRRSSEYCSREDDRTKTCNCKEPSYDYDECDSTSTSSDSCSSSGSGGSGCQCPEHRERLRAQREQQTVCCCRNNRRTASKCSIFSCFKKKEKRCECNKPKQQKRERSTSKCSIFSCFRKKEKLPSQMRGSNYSRTSNMSDDEKRKGSKFSGFFCGKKERRRSPPSQETKSKSSGPSCFKKKEKPPSQQSEYYDKRDGSRYAKKDNDSQSEKTKSKSSGLPCFRKKEKPENYGKKEESRNVENGKPKPRSNGPSCFKRKERPPQSENYGKKERRTSETENDTQSEKSKSKSSGLSCFKKKEKPENYDKKPERRTVEKDKENEKTKSKSGGLPCFRKKEKQPPSLDSENYERKQGRRTAEKDNENEKTKSKSSGLPCFRKKEKPPSLQKENYGKKERQNLETENDTQSEKSKSKSGGLPCFRKKEKPPSQQTENYERKRERRTVEKDNETEKNKPKSGGLPCFRKKEKERRNIETENDTQSEKPKSKSSGLPCFKKREKPEEKERDYPKQGEKKPSWLTHFQRTSRKGDETSEKQEKTKKASRIPECFRCQRNPPPTRMERNVETECTCGEYQQPTCMCAQQQHNNNEEVKVLYDSSFRFNQDSCSCGDITETCCCCNPQELPAQERSTCPRTAIRYGQCECANGFYKIGQ